MTNIKEIHYYDENKISRVDYEIDTQQSELPYSVNTLLILASDELQTIQLMLVATREPSTINYKKIVTYEYVKDDYYKYG